MPRTIERTVYKFSELSERAKDKARSAMRYRDVEFDNWWGFTFEDAVTVAALMGIDIGRDGRRPAICFSGFCSQGDGASFSGWYNHKPDAVANVRAHAPQDEELIAIAEGLVVMQTTARLVHGARLYARIETSGHYSHSGTMGIGDANYVDTEGEAPHCPDEIADDLLALFRRFADWIYAQLEAEHDYLTSDEHLDEYLSKEEFDEDGSVI